MTFEKIHWDVAGQVYLADLCAIGFIVSFAADRLAKGDNRLPWTSFVAMGFLIAFLVVYLVGYFNLDTAIAATQYGKGMTKFAIHFLFLILGVAFLARASRTFYWQTLGFFTAGMVVNSVYGILQPAARRAPGRASTRRCCRRSPAARATSTSTGRSRARTSTGRTRSPVIPNHLGIMLIIPLLALAHARLPAPGAGSPLEVAARRSRSASCSSSS